MKAGILSGDTYKKFKDFILPEVYSGIEDSFPYLVIGLVEKKDPIGALVGYVEDSGMFNMASIYVRPDYRRQGGGMMLIFEMREIMRKNKIPAAVISYIEMEDEGESLEEFFDAIGAIQRDDLAMLYRVWPWENPDEVEEAEEEDTSITISRLKGVPEAKLKIITDQAGGGFKPTGFDIGKLSLDEGLSFAAFSDKKAVGYLLAYTGGDDGNSIVLDISFSCEDEAIRLLYMEFLKAYFGEYSGEAKEIYLPAPDSRIENIIDIKDLEILQHNYVLF